MQRVWRADVPSPVKGSRSPPGSHVRLGFESCLAMFTAGLGVGVLGGGRRWPGSR